MAILIANDETFRSNFYEPPYILKVFEPSHNNPYAIRWKKIIWVGDETKLLKVQLQDLRELDYLPWELEELVELGSFEYRYFLRKDILPYPIRNYLKSWHLFLNNLQLINRRLLYTFQVWNLASIPPGSIPSWKHHFGKRS